MGKSGNARPKIGRGSRLWEKYNRPTPPFAWFTRQMMESPAWSAMSLPARKVLDRLCVEHMAHAGTENGKLIVTYSNLRASGIGGKSLSKAINELEALGWIRVQRGRGGNAEFRTPSRYTLTWLATDFSPPTDSWRSMTMERVKAIKVELSRNRRPKKKSGPHDWSEAAPPAWPKGGPPV